MEALSVDIKEEAATSHTESSPLDANVPSSSNSGSSCVGSVEDHMRASMDAATMEEINRLLAVVNSLSDIAKVYFYLKLPGNGSGGIQSNANHNTNLSNQAEMNHASVWISTHLELDPNICLRKDEVYKEYKCYCDRHQIKCLNTADFGKAMKRCFPTVKPRRLGQRGQSKYCYGGLKKKERFESPSLTEFHFDEGDEEKLTNLVALDEEHCRFLVKYLSAHLGRSLTSLEEAVSVLATTHPGPNNNLQLKASSPNVHSIRRTNSQLSGVAMSPMSDASSNTTMSGLVRPEARRTLETGLVRAASSPSHQRSDLAPLSLPNFSTPPGRSSQPPPGHANRLQHLMTGASSPLSAASPFRPVSSGGSGHGLELPPTPNGVHPSLLATQPAPSVQPNLVEMAASYYSQQQQQQQQLHLSAMAQTHHPPPTLSPHLPSLRQSSQLPPGQYLPTAAQQTNSPVLLMPQPQQAAVVKCEAVQTPNTPPQAHMPTATTCAGSVGGGGGASQHFRRFINPPPHPAPLPPVGAGSSPYSSSTLMRTAAPPPPAASAAGEEMVLLPKRVLKRQPSAMMMSAPVDNDSKWQRLLQSTDGPDVAAVEDDAFNCNWNASALSPMPNNDVGVGGDQSLDYGLGQTSSDLDDLFSNLSGPNDGPGAVTGPFTGRTTDRLEVGCSPCPSPTRMAVAPFAQVGLVKSEPPGTPKSAERPGRPIGSLSQRLDDQHAQQQDQQVETERSDSAASRLRGELNTPVPLPSPTPNMTPGTLTSQ